MEILPYQTMGLNVCIIKVKAKHKTKPQQPPLLVLGYNFREDSVQVSPHKYWHLRTCFDSWQIPLSRSTKLSM